MNKNIKERQSQRNEEAMNKIRKNTYLITFIFFVIIFFILWEIIVGNFDTSSTSAIKEKPDEIELMSYAQTILKDNIYNPKYSSYKEEYNFIETGLRYKIEGKVNNENFWIIIEFVDDTYKEYNLISLQIGNKKIY